MNESEEVFWWDVWQTSLYNPRFSDFAKSCGGLGIRVTKSEQLKDVLKKALSYKGFSLIEIVSDAELI